MQQGGIFNACERLINQLHILDFESASANAKYTKSINSLHTHLQNVEAIVRDIGISFNATGQNKDLDQALKELDLLREDFLELKSVQLLGDVQYIELVGLTEMLDAEVRAMNDPDFSF